MLPDRRHPPPSQVHWPLHRPLLHRLGRRCHRRHPLSRALRPTATLLPYDPHALHHPDARQHVHGLARLGRQDLHPETPRRRPFRATSDVLSEPGQVPGAWAGSSQRPSEGSISGCHNVSYQVRETRRDQSWSVPGQWVALRWEVRAARGQLLYVQQVRRVAAGCCDLRLRYIPAEEVSRHVLAELLL